jgi:hypothetical protein
MSGPYVVTIKDGITKHCPVCATVRPVYAVVDEGVRIWACCFCSRIVKREKEPEPVAAQ